MKRMLWTALGLAIAVTTGAQDVQSEIELTRAVIQTERQALVAAAMDLTPTEADAFWPLYREYQSQRAAIGDREVQLITDYADNYLVMTDDKAATMLDEWFDIQNKDLALKKKYIKKFRKILPDLKVTRYFQLENKLDAVIDNELAAEIPLVE
jgi:hypothetical protein